MTETPTPDDGLSGYALLFEGLLDGTVAPESLDPEHRALGEMLAVARDPATAEELAGTEEMVARFTALQKSRRSVDLRRRVSVAASVVGVAFGGLTAAAYANALPASLQGFAHRTIHAPSASSHHSTPVHPEPTVSETPAAHPTPAGPDATGAAAVGLCQAFRSGGLDQHSVGYRQLLSAATTANTTVDGYCATVPHPTPAPHATGKPTSHPTGKPASHPTGKPTALPTPANSHASSHPTPPAHPTPVAHATGTGSGTAGVHRH